MAYSKVLERIQKNLHSLWLVHYPDSHVRKDLKTTQYKGVRLQLHDFILEKQAI